MDRLTALKRTELVEALQMIAKLEPDERAEQAIRPEFVALLNDAVACLTPRYSVVTPPSTRPILPPVEPTVPASGKPALTAGDHEDVVVAKDELKARNWNVAILPADTELVVMTKCDKMLSKLKSSAQLRVIEWLESRLRERFGSDGPQNG